MKERFTYCYLLHGYQFPFLQEVELRQDNKSNECKFYTPQR